MKPEQLNWTDKEWASHLQWDVRNIPALRKWLNEHYFASIAINQDNGNYTFYISRLDFAPSGATCFMPLVSFNTKFNIEKQARQYANEVIIPALNYAPMAAQEMGIPERVLQMLHIKEKQK